MTGGTGPLHRRSSGIPGLDGLLHGGFVNNRLYLVLGAPGTGKTLVGAEFLRAGIDAGEDALFVHGEESREDLVVNAAEIGVDLADADFLDVGPASEFFARSKTYDVVRPQDVEDDHLIADVRSTIEDRDPDRILIDPISQFQYIEPNEYQFRKRIIAFTRFLKDRETTVLATKTPATRMNEQLRSLSDGVISLEHHEEGRRISVPKHRGVGQRDGTHGMEIGPEGVDVYPALEPTESDRTFDPVAIHSGVEGLDALLDGGLERGTVTVISGPSGVGKSTTATEFLQVAANQDGGLAYLFEESLETFTHRAEAFDIPVSQLRDEGALVVEEVQALERSPEEFARLVEAQVEETAPSVVVLDGIEGYRTAIKGGDRTIDLRQRLHALTRYLTNMNVTVVLVDERHEVTGLPRATGSNISYLADNIVFQQYVELEGEFQRVVGVLKKRVSGFEKAPRRFSITADGLVVGDSLTNLHGVLEGVPERRAPGVGSGD